MGKRDKYQQKPKKDVKFMTYIIFGIIISAVIYATCIQDNNNYHDKKKILINTDRKVESAIIQDYFKDKTDQYNVVQKYTPQGNHSKDYYLQWAHFHWDINFQGIKSNQIVSHIPGISDLYDDKNKMADTIRAYDKKTNYKIKSDQFLPLTLTWDINKKQYSADEKQLFSIKGDKDKWIVKNPLGMGGKGIKIIDNIQQYAQKIKYAKDNRTNDPEFNRFKQAQQYIKNPLLINNKKSEYRAYVLIVSTDPFLIVFNKGFVKTALKDYDYNTSDMKAHLTNLLEARKNEAEYNKIKNNAYLNVEDFENLLKNKHNKTQIDIKQYYEKITQISTYSILAGLSKIKRQPQAFETFALDILLDEDLNPYLLEINQPYAVEGANLKGYKDVLPDFYHSTLDLVLQVYDQNSDKNEVIKDQNNLKLGKNMKIVYNEANGYNYLEE